jgi:hypothetical protein
MCVQVFCECFPHKCTNNKKRKGKGKAIPLNALTGPEGSRRLRLPDFKKNDKWQGWKPYAPTAFTLRKYNWYSFLLEAV